MILDKPVFKGRSDTPLVFFMAIYNTTKVINEVYIMAEAPKVTEEVKAPKAPKAEKFYFRNAMYAGVKIQVQKMVENKATGKPEQELDEELKFTQYYDTYKGDTIRVGYAVTESEKLAEACRADEYCEEIDEKEFTLAIEGDAKHKPLVKAPVPAE